jgi:peptide/nickel transport system permease protein
MKAFPWRQVNVPLVVGGLIVLLMVLMAVFAPRITGYGFESVDLSSRNEPPSAEHPLGTDGFGRDVWTRVAFGARISLTVSLSSVLVGLALGAALGLVVGTLRGAVDFVVGRVMDVAMSFPMILMSMLIGVALGPSLLNMCWSVGIPLIPVFYRVTRAAALNVGERAFVTAAKTMGAGNVYTMARHIFPNTIPQMLVMMSFSMGGAITAESALGFLGLGIPRPTPSWGMVINEGRQYIFDAPWITGFSGLMIMLTILGFNLLGDGLRDILDPRLKQ